MKSLFEDFSSAVVTCSQFWTKGKVPPGCLLAEPVIQVTRFFVPLGARLWHYATDLRTLSVTYPMCGSALTNNMDILSEMCPLQLTDFACFCTINHAQSYKGRLFPQWLSQIVMTRGQTCYHQVREPTL